MTEEEAGLGKPIPREPKKYKEEKYRPQRQWNADHTIWTDPDGKMGTELPIPPKE